MWHWLAQFFGFTAGGGNGAHYLFWSGAGSDIAELAIAGSLIALVRKHNCHVHGCWRIGRHPVEGTPYLVCRHHHPGGAVTREQILSAHRAHQARKQAVEATVKRIRTQPRDQPPAG